MTVEAEVGDLGDWWPEGFVGDDDGALLSAVDSEGVRRDVHVVIGGHREVRGGPQGRPQAFLVHMPPHDQVPAHFHRIDQFQVFFGASGARYQRTDVARGTVLVQYADAYATYGPFSSGDEMLDFYTLRAAGDGVTAFMPGARDLLVHRGRRLLQVPVPLDAGRPGGAQPRTDPVIGPEPDAMACFVLRGPAGSTVTGPDPAGTGGHFYVVVGGAAECQGRRFRPKAVAWVPPGGEALTLGAGDGPGFDVLVVQYPSHPSFPLPDPISRW